VRKRWSTEPAGRRWLVRARRCGGWSPVRVCVEGGSPVRAWLPVRAGDGRQYEPQSPVRPRQYEQVASTSRSEELLVEGVGEPPGDPSWGGQTGKEGEAGGRL
jgi:hypothetical protein